MNLGEGGGRGGRGRRGSGDGQGGRRGRGRRGGTDRGAEESESYEGGRGGGRGRGRRGRGSGVEATSAVEPLPTRPDASASSVSSRQDVISLGGDMEKRLSLLEQPAAAAPVPVAAAVAAPPPAVSSRAAPAPVAAVAAASSVAVRPVAPKSSTSVRPPHRPGYGTAGRKCIIRANHLLVQIQTQKTICHYDVSISPEVPSRGVNRMVMHRLVKLHGESHLGNRLPAYDGRKNLYTAGELPFTSKQFTIELEEKDKEASKNTKSARVFHVDIKLVGNADIYHLSQFMKGKVLDEPHQTIHALDIVMRESLSMNYVTLSRSFFSPRFGNPNDLGDGVECWKGFYQSLRPTQMGLSLNIDVSATSFYQPQMVIQFVTQCLNVQDTSKPLSDTERVKVKKALRGIKVEVTHRPGTMRFYRITGITNMPMKQLTFDFGDKETTRVSVVEYFRRTYNVQLKYTNWPCIQAGSDSRPTYLPMEVCQIVAGQRYTKKLNEQQVRAMLKATCKRPHERENNIVNIARQNNYTGDRFAKEFGIKVQNELTTIEARVLHPPILQYHQTGEEKVCKPIVGQWNMIGKRMVNGGTLRYWACLNLSRLNTNAVDAFCHDLLTKCRDIGMTVEFAPVIRTSATRPENLGKGLSEVHRLCSQRLARENGEYLQLLIIVLPERSGSYGEIKRICETELGIVSQCCQPRKVGRVDHQYLENVSLKINVKVNGRNTVLLDAISYKIPFVTDKPTIIFGADVTHPMPGEDSSPSIAAVVASMDWPQVTNYRCLLSSQTHRQEIIRDLFIAPENGQSPGGMIRDHLIAFWKKTKMKPHRIIFYRDGVSEGQFNQVLLYEMDAIRKACQSLEKDYLPPVTFVVVQKRHHTRFFPNEPGNRQMTDRSGNILPGTIVDTKICHPTEFDFYLCSHAGIQGTSRPTHYHVLFDENNFSADALQTLTNNLCYTYARCTRSVSVVPPAYYAHLAAFRARYYISSDSDRGTSSGESSSIRTPISGPTLLPSVKEEVKEVMFYC